MFNPINLIFDLLPFYAILRSIPNKLLGVIAMFFALLIILILPITDLSKWKGLQFRLLTKIAFYMFVFNLLILMALGAKHVESPFIELGQVSTIFYFSWFLVIIPFVSSLENTLVDLAIKSFKYIVSNPIGLEHSRSISSYKSYILLSEHSDVDVRCINNLIREV